MPLKLFYHTIVYCETDNGDKTSYCALFTNLSAAKYTVSSYFFPYLVMQTKHQLKLLLKTVGVFHITTWMLIAEKNDLEKLVKHVMNWQTLDNIRPRLLKIVFTCNVLFRATL